MDSISAPIAPVYVLENVLVETSYPGSTYFDSVIIRMDSLYTDSILNLRINMSDVHDEFGRNGDTLFYTGDPQLLYGTAKASFAGKRYNSSLFMAMSQYGGTKSEVGYLYNSSNRLSGFNMNTEIYMDAYTVLVHNSQNTLSYANNDITQIQSPSTYRTDYVYYNTDGYTFDTTLHINDLVSISYLPDANQKDLIGIDLNDLVFNAFLDLYSYNTIRFTGLINYTTLEKALLLNNFITYNTNCTHLMETFQFVQPTGSLYTFLFPNVGIKATYTFDAAKNNRVKTLEIKTQNVADGLSVWAKAFTVRYTFHYKS